MSFVLPKKCFITWSLDQIMSFISRNHEVNTLHEWLKCSVWCACEWVHHCECVRLVRVRSCSGMATLVSRCHCGVVTCGGGVRTLWATPGAFSSDHSSPPRVTMETRSSSSEHQATEPPLVGVLSLERNRDTLEKTQAHNYLTKHTSFLHKQWIKQCGCQSPGYKVMWSWGQLSQRTH